MPLKDNLIWNQLASVRLALLIIALLSITSIFGTVVPQGESFSFYLERFGTKNALILEILALNNMYSSVWFRTLLIIFSMNLIVCSYTRIPLVIKVIKKDNINIDIKKIEDDVTNINLVTDKRGEIVADVIRSSLNNRNIHLREKRTDDSILMFFQKGAWTRLGAYIVHLSILVIILGAIIGGIFGFKAFVMIPEGESTDVVYSQDESRTSVPLGFEVFCNKFDIDYYQNGTPKEYRSDLSVFENGKEVIKKRITVNNPLSHNGITFYQSSYQPIPNEYTVNISLATPAIDGNQIGRQESFSVQPNKTITWNQADVRFKIVASSEDGHGHGPYKIWFDDKNNNAITFVTNDKQPFEIKSETGNYLFTISQRYATGLQVVKDPGVWLVYIGCILMLFGLFVSFFMSHRKVWISVRESEAGTTVFVKGSASKHTDKMQNIKEQLVTELQGIDSLGLRRL